MILDAIAKFNNIAIIHPFFIKIDNRDVEFCCLIKGYGAKNGTIVDAHYEKYRMFKDPIIDGGYTFSCFDIMNCSPDVDFSEMLLEWGICK